ncbi:MAG: DUF349 domain-containing protein [Bacteroidales bacterium]|nr:DUF349 domain-containing protein [Bacteroidales bacterium]
MSTKDPQNSDSVPNEQQNEKAELNSSDKDVNSDTGKDKTEEISEKQNEITEEDDTEKSSQEIDTKKDEETLEVGDNKITKPVKAKKQKAKTEIDPQKNSESTEVDDNKVEESVKEENHEVKTDIDYAKLSREDLVKELSGVIDTLPINEIRKEVEGIKAFFYKKQKALNEQKRKDFLGAGGNIDDFALVEDPVETELKDLFKRYRRLKADSNRQLEQVKEVNLEKKSAIIEELKELVNKDESIGDTFKEFRELQLRWKEIGQVPQQKLKDLWSTYHHHVEKFYDYININKELRDLDLKKNLEIKIGLCEKAEKLMDESSVVTAFKTLQKFHNQWREIGPVPNESKDEIWERFKEATRVINKNHQDYFKGLKDEQKSNLERKEKLCVQAEEIAEIKLESHKEWSAKTEAIIEIQKVWRTIGFAPKKENNKIYARFRNACDSFFGNKREFYAQNKELQDENLNKKIELCEKAESLQESTDWKATTKDLINIQKEWKTIGPVSKKQSDKVWKRFRATCDHFFNRKSEYYANIDQEYDANLNLKKDIIEKIKKYEFSTNVKENFEALKKFQEEFSEVGFVPYKLKDKIQNEFREELNKLFDKLKVDDKEKNLLKFQTRLDTLQHKPKSSNKIKHERDKFFNKIKKLESDISLWENNIGFFSSDSDEAKEMLKDYHKKIESAKKEMAIMEEKIRMIDKSDSE